MDRRPKPRKKPTRRCAKKHLLPQDWKPSQPCPFCSFDQIRWEAGIEAEKHYRDNDPLPALDPPPLFLTIRVRDTGHIKYFTIPKHQARPKRKHRPAKRRAV